jgi:hypothetical protein
VDSGEIQLCDDDHTLEADVQFTTDVRTLSEVWMGDISLRDARANQRLRIEAKPPFLRTLSSWMGLSPYADLPRKPVR